MHNQQGGPRTFSRPQYFHSAARRFAKEQVVDKQEEKDGVVVNVMAVVFEVAIIYGFWMTVSWIFGLQ